ncbi:MAG: aspartate 1-decarboxylase [Candidatus Binatia bacterium]
MLRRMMRSKIHRATVTRTDLHYEGSISVDADLLDAASMLPYEAVWIWNVNNGERFETYTLAGARGSGEICLNGAAARKAARGDLIIIATFGWMEEEKARRWEPIAVMVDGANQLRAQAA